MNTHMEFKSLLLQDETKVNVFLEDNGTLKEKKTSLKKVEGWSMSVCVAVPITALVKQVIFESASTKVFLFFPSLFDFESTHFLIVVSKMKGNGDEEDVARHVPKSL